MLAMGRALMSHPKTILMDEPSMGLSPKLVKEIFSIIRKLHEQGITILLVEQNAKMALSIADRAYVLETGRITMEGDAKELLNNEQVRKAYLAPETVSVLFRRLESEIIPAGGFFMPFPVLFALQWAGESSFFSLRRDWSILRRFVPNTRVDSPYSTASAFHALQ